MRLSEHPDFDQAIIAARAHFAQAGLSEALIEKDYYVTEALRAAASLLQTRLIFKGGTSLSKGWGLIERFSEDIDLFVDPVTPAGRLSKRGIDREMKAARDSVAAHPALEFDAERSRTIGGFGRSDYFRYDQRFAATAAIAPAVLVEAGSSSGRYPTEMRSISSLVGQFLRESDQSLGADDETPFMVNLLHFRRTFVEKMFAIHAKVELAKRDGGRLGTYARHYYDLYCLAQRAEVRSMLAGAEYEDIRLDYERISTGAFPRDYIRPPGMRFDRSDAFFPTGLLREMIASDYERECRALCYGPFPDWSTVEAVFVQLRPLL